MVLPFVEGDIGRKGSELIIISVREPNGNLSSYKLQAYLEKIAETVKLRLENIKKILECRTDIEGLYLIPILCTIQ